MNDERSRQPGLEFSSDDERLLDRLVDGTLDLPSQRDLLTRLDQIPDGWRRCGLAFLEAQAWHSEFLQLRSESDHLVRGAVPHERPEIAKRPSPDARAIARLVGVALALSVAFGLGRLSMPVEPRSQGEIVRAPARDTLPGRTEEGVVKIVSPIVAPEKSRETEPDDDVHVAARLSWQLQEDGAKRKIEVPVFEGRGLDMEWLMQQPTAVQESIRKALERRGHKVETQRQLLTVNLKDGRSVVVPIDQVQVKFAKRIFQ